MKRFHKFWQLPLQDQLLLIQSVIVLVVVVLGLRVCSWSILQRILLKPAIWRSRSKPEQRPSPARIARAIRAASRVVPKASCLPQALTAQHMLVQRAYPAELQIGVAINENGKLEAHAWVTSTDGIVIGDTPNWDRFVRLLPTEKKSIDHHGKLL
jgi:hypothetical protein